MRTSDLSGEAFDDWVAHVAGLDGDEFGVVGVDCDQAGADEVGAVLQESGFDPALFLSLINQQSSLSSMPGRVCRERF